MSTQTARNTLSIRTATRSLIIAVILTLSLGGAASADVAGKVDDALSRIKKIQSQVKEIPRDGVFREMLDHVDPAVVAGLLEAAGDAREVLDVARAQREGFDEYKNGGGADRMRADLLWFVGDLRELAEASQKIRCLDDPEITVVPMNTRFITKAVGEMPAIVLYSTQKMLDEQMPDWRTALQPIMQALPVDQISQLCGAPSEIEEQFEMTRCEVLRTIDPHQARRITRLSAFAADALAMITRHMKDELTIGVAAVVAGGGGATITVKNHLKPVLEAVHSMLDSKDAKSLVKLSGHILKERKACLAADDRMERDLLSCTALASYDTSYATIHDLAARRVDSMSVTYGSVANVLYADDFHQLCSAYQDVRNPE